MASFIAMLVGSKVGRFFASAFLIAAGLGALLLKVFLAGKASERAKQTEQSLKNLRKRVRTDEEIRNMPTSAVRDELRSEWLRHD